MSDWRRASVASVRSLVRGVPLFFSVSPRTPLRVLGIIALDTLHVLRYAKVMPRRRMQEVARFLDFAGCINAWWDHKVHPAADSGTIRRRLEADGYHACLETYVDCLRDLERNRPSVMGDRQRFGEVRRYREGVARLALTTAATIALQRECRDDHDVDTLFRILMQCQIIDDVLDYAGDLTAGLPTFLTASASLSQGLVWTTQAARDYGTTATRGATGILPFRVALAVVTLVTTLVLQMARRRQQLTRPVAHP